MADHNVTVNWPAPPPAAETPDPVQAAVRQAVATAYIETMKGSVDRALKRVELITGAAGAIGTLYTGVLALRFGAGEKSTPVTSWAVAPAIFLGFAVVFGIGYRAFLPGSQGNVDILPNDAATAVRNYIVWVSKSVHARSWMLNAAVIALAGGIASSPAPFLERSDAETLVDYTVGVGIILFVLSLVIAALSNGDRNDGTPPPTKDDGLPSVPSATGAPVLPHVTGLGSQGGA